MLNFTETLMRDKKMEWEYEKAEKIFTNESINGELINFDSCGFSREFAFTVNGVYYEVTWFKNQSTLKIGEEGQCHVMFFMAELSNTWPSHQGSKMKIQFRDAKGNCVAVIPIDFY